MVDFNICLAEKTIAVSANYESTREFCRHYLCDTPADFSVSVSMEDIIREDEASDNERRLEGLPPYKYSYDYLETLALYRKIAEKMAEFDTILFHGSAVMLDGEGYIFTARSGTGKSTHTRLWRETFGERAVMINDDKPLIAMTENGAVVYGTPWCGKHHLGANISAPLRAICILGRSLTNEIGKVSYLYALPELLSQTYRFPNPDGMQRVLATLQLIASNVGIFRLGCNMEREAAIVAYNGMKGETK